MAVSLSLCASELDTLAVVQQIGYETTAPMESSTLPEECGTLPVLHPSQKMRELREANTVCRIDWRFVPPAPSPPRLLPR
jgi:hypothetical protein